MHIDMKSRYEELKCLKIQDFQDSSKPKYVKKNQN